MSAGRAVVVGTVGLDLVADSGTAGTARAAVGNSGSNIAVRLAAEGVEVEFVALIGPDSAGDLVRDDLRRWGVGTTGLVVGDDYLTPRVFQVLDPDAASSGGASSLLFTCPRCGLPRGHRLQPPQAQEIPPAVMDFAATADAVIADLPGGAAQALWQATGGLRWFEASMRETTPAEIAVAARLATHAKVSAEEIDHYEQTFADHPEGGSPGGTLAALARFVTLGAEGVRYQTRQAPGLPWSGWATSASALTGAPVDTLGAGDAWTAAAVAALIRHEPLEEVLAAAADRAAAACRSEGARGDMTVAGGGSAWLREDVPFLCGRCEIGYREPTPGTAKERHG